MVKHMNNIYISDFLSYLEVEANYSKNTINSYENDLNKFEEYYKNKDLLKITSKDIEKYIQTLSDLAPTTVSHNISSLKTFYSYFLKQVRISNNPTDGIKSPKLGIHLPTYLTIDEVNKLLDIEVTDAFSSRNKAILELMYATGLRISEVISLEFKNVDYDECIIRVMGKGSKERIVPVNDYAIKYLKEYIDNYRPELVKNDINNYIFYHLIIL